MADALVVLVIHNASLLTLPVAVFFGLAFVLLFFTCRQTNVQLRNTSFVEIQFKRDQCYAFALDRANDTVDLALGVMDSLQKPLCILTPLI